MEKLTILEILVLTIISAVLYRMGGSGNYPRQARQVGCALCVVAGLWVIGYHTWWLILTLLLQFGALTTYFKKKGTDAQWYNWLFVGLAYSFAVLPVVWGDWSGFWLRSIVLTVSTTLWSQFNGNAVWEETGRGALIILTLPMLLIA